MKLNKVFFFEFILLLPFLACDEMGNHQADISFELISHKEIEYIYEKCNDGSEFNELNNTVFLNIKNNGDDTLTLDLFSIKNKTYLLAYYGEILSTDDKYIINRPTPFFPPAHAERLNPKTRKIYRCFITIPNTKSSGYFFIEPSIRSKSIDSTLIFNGNKSIAFKPPVLIYWHDENRIINITEKFLKNFEMK